MEGTKGNLGDGRAGHVCPTPRNRNTHTHTHTPIQLEIVLFVESLDLLETTPRRFCPSASSRSRSFSLSALEEHSEHSRRHVQAVARNFSR